MSSNLITDLDETFSNSNTDAVYPHIFLDTAHTQALPLILGLLEEGDIPIYFNQDGETYELARIDRNPLNLAKLLRVYKFKLITSADTSIDITDNISLLEACKWTH